MPNRIEARSAKAALTNATGRLPLLRLFSTPLKCPSQAVATMFTNASLFPTQAEQHQTLRMPPIAIGTSHDNRSARRLRIAGVLIPLIPTN
jgi:hypothetical protein